MPKTDDGHTTCTSCRERVRSDRVDKRGVCVNCLALGRTPATQRAK